MMNLQEATRMRTRVRHTLYATTAVALSPLLLGIGGAIVNGMTSKKYEGGGGGGGDQAWGSVQSTLTTQTGRALRIFEPYASDTILEPAAQETNGAADQASPSAPVPAPESLLTDASPSHRAANPSVARAEGEAPNAAETSAGVVSVAAQPVSTFAADVDTSSYSNLRRMILQGEAVDRSKVRVEEMVNYFRYALPAAPTGAPFSVTTDVARTPWNDSSMLMRVALNGRVVPKRARAPANIVLLVDVSGSMESDDRIGLVKRSFSDMVDHLSPRDRVSIVTYSDGATLALAATGNRARIKSALASLRTGGGTAGGDGLKMAYAQVRRSRIDGGINRVMIASDGDFNVGMSDVDALRGYIRTERNDGITLSTLGVGERFNDDLMESLADAGNGNAAFLDDDLEARKVLSDELESSIHMIAKDVKAQVEFNPAAVSSYRLVGYRNRRLAERSFDDDAVDAGEIGSGHQVTAIYEIFPAAGIAGTDVASRRRYAANRVRDELAVTPTSDATGEAMWVKIRYKDPDGTASKLLSTPVQVGALASATAPTGDAAFAFSVAGFGMLLDGTLERGSAWDAARVASLAGHQTQATRREFVDMVRERGDAAIASAYASQPQPYEAPVQQPVQTYTPPVQPEPLLVPVTRYSPMALILRFMMGLSVLLAVWLAALSRHPAFRNREDEDRKRRPAARDEHAHDEQRHRLDISTLSGAINAARVNSSDKAAAPLAALELAAGTAVDRVGTDAVGAEIEVIVNSHATRFLNEYVAVRRRATAGSMEEVEDEMIRTADTLSERLRSLVEARTKHDAQRLSEHGSFIADRHGPGDPAIA